METIKAKNSLPDKDSRGRSGTAFPAYSLPDSIAVAKVIYDRGGGQATKEHLAAFLGYKSTNNGAFLSRVGAAKLFGLIESSGDTLRLTQLGQRVLMPESSEDLRQALVDAFLTVPLFKRVYEEYRGKDLPEGLGLKNALRLKFQILPGRIDLAYRTLFDSAETAGFFEVRGSKTQLIIPITKAPSKSQDEQQNGDEESRSFKGGGGGKPPSLPKSRDELQNEYIGALIEVLREKSKQGEMDNELMERIERLLNLKTA